ncbi:MAG TPA: hypothetical protein VJK51_02505 [Candidatus Nanoarchaeia archaeon]|nr:hypothetical protein [Candidatus Nanoarchaeia archaeon]
MNIERLLSTRGLVEQAPNAEDIRGRVGSLSPEPIKLFYGETYDEAGNPIDSMKYYIFVAELAEALKREGANVDPSILIADTAACRNVGKNQEEYYMRLGEDRAKFVRQVNDTYKTGLRVVKMSEYIDSPTFVEKRDQVINFCSNNPQLMEAVEKTVPESKIDIERSKGFLYSFDEITTIMDLDVKVGPPREDLYDDVARTITGAEGEKGLMSLFLTPTFPLGMRWSYFFANEGIEDHGITAYKAASKRLQGQRIIIQKSDPTRIRELVRDSFISTNPSLPNPVLDVGIISEMARKRLEADDSPITLADDFYSGKISETQLKERVGRDVEKYVLSQF